MCKDNCTCGNHCWYCNKNDDKLQFSTEFDTPVHVDCIENALKKDSENLEARIMAEEFGLEVPPEREYPEPVGEIFVTVGKSDTEEVEESYVPESVEGADF